jgi:hypothetical protein
MAVTLIRTDQFYQCLAADTKPTTGVEIGAGLFETDTGASWRYNGSTWVKINSAAIDSSTYARTTIDYGHHEVHGGSAYWCANNATLGNGEINTVSITTPDTEKWAHLLLEITASATATFDVLEDVTSLAGGTSFTPLNFNRNSNNTSGMTCTVGDTPGTDAITPTGGTSIWVETLGTRGITHTRDNAAELILSQDSIYLFRITNGASANNCTILLTWYEHTDKE